MKRFSVLLFLFLSLGISTALWGGAAADPLGSALRPEWVQPETDHRIPGDDRLIVVIGESHPNVRGQLHLADQLGQLLSEKQVEAILVEGSEGSIQTRDLLGPSSKLLSQEALSSYWRRLLEWGQLSGWEYVALVSPQTPAYGVEDMIAKYRFAIQALSGSDEELKGEVSSAGRGADLLEQSLATLEQGGVALPEARAALAHHRKEIQDYATAAERFGEKRKPMFAKQMELLETAAEVEKLIKESGLAKLRQMKDAKGRLQEHLERLQREQPNVLVRLYELQGKREALERDLEHLKVEVQPASETVAALGEAVQDNYFTLANLLRATTEGRWGHIADVRPSAVDASLRQVENFFRDELEKARKEDLARSRTQLAERDRLMAANTERYLRETGTKRVVLIVGAAHLEGIAENLQRLSLPFVCGRLLPNEKEEPWELQAWERRREPFPAVLTASDIKEESRLLDPVWREEQIVRFRKWGHTPAGQPHVIKGKREGELRIVFRSSQLDGQRVARGDQVVDFGPVPGYPDQFSETWDREVGRHEVSQFSNDLVGYGYGYYDEDRQGRRHYKVTTSRGDHSLQDFLKTPPSGDSGKLPSYVVILHEPDIQLENGVPRSPFWYSARRPSKPLSQVGASSKEDGGIRKMTAAASGGGGGRKSGDGKATADGSDDKHPNGGDNAKGGGGNGSSPPGGRWTAFDRDPEKREPALLRTTQIPRSGRNLEKLARQKPLEPAEVALLKEPQALEDVYFSQEDGTHAGLIVLMAKNSEEFRSAVQRAAELKKLTHKQVALITCGDLHRETAELREILLFHGALMVWTLDRQITPQAGERLLTQIGETLRRGTETGWRPRDMDELLERSITDLVLSDPTDPDLGILWESGAWVDFRHADWERLPATEPGASRIAWTPSPAPRKGRNESATT